VVEVEVCGGGEVGWESELWCSIISATFWLNSMATGLTCNHKDNNFR
jgi:hypothetical protein